ncbi:Peptidase C1 and/or Inhibitor I29 domain containing protein [Asbolus verrucosus]|uniref:Peptidase C1 and/or Inhibitor I29 domain containing protein n=1 Tax=Asbolus verrucosus TaxID=1661398 RepID=A0A482VG30_ASBVE|nr:Peptidase C1 and/or Inhibitor I29 domain containing protein [Asbolus verrucosus]
MILFSVKSHGHKNGKLLRYVHISSYSLSDKLAYKCLQKTYKKIYQNENEEKYRERIFLDNLQQIEEHNRKYDQGLVTYTVKVNHFADHTVEELYPSLKLNTKTRRKISKPLPRRDVPESIDWRDYGVITPIINQESCLSCWAFAVVAALEAHAGIYSATKNVSLSTQNLLDCVYPAFDCDEEMERDALEVCYQYILRNGGIDTADSYPYENMSGNGCRFDNDTIGARITDYGTVAEGDEDQLKTVVGTIGPASVIITVDFTFMVYQSGVYYKENCTNTKEPYNHAVTVIGYGNEDGQDYWLIKNEWGLFFGDNGYIKMARNRDNHCGIATYASYPVVEN